MDRKSKEKCTMYKEALRKAEYDVASMLKNQITEQTALHYGGIRCIDTWDVNFHDTAAFYVWSVRLYLNRDSIYYKNEVLYERMMLAYQYCYTWMHEDGTKDYIDCDFYTAAGSEVQNLAKTIYILDQYEEDEEKDFLREKSISLMKALAEGLVHGGFHTPNHRWIFSGALAAVNSIVPDERYMAKINQYLLEGIDCNEDGEYAERSAGIYDFVTNEGLILMARYLKRPEFYEYVKRNLYMLRSYIEPDGSIFTMNSTRQDFGTTIWAEKYFSEYLYISEIFKDNVLRKTADKLYRNAKSNGRELPVTLEFLLLNPQFRGYQPLEEMTDEKEVLEGLYGNAGIMRRVQDEISLSLIKGSKTFFFAEFGDIKLFMRMSGHFFKVRNIIPEQLRKIKDGYQITFYAEGNFLLPLKEKPETSDWWKMDHTKRDLLKRTELSVELDVLPEEDGVTFRLRTKTCDQVPFRVEIGIVPNCTLLGDGFQCKAQAGMWLIPTKGMVRAETVNHAIEIGPMFGEHGRVSGREGSAPRSGAHMTLYMNQFCTAEERVFHIKKVK